jgi:hypothetical protein
VEISPAPNPIYYNSSDKRRSSDSRMGLAVMVNPLPALLLASFCAIQIVSIIDF